MTPFQKFKCFGAIAVCCLGVAAGAWAAELRAKCQIGGFALGCQAYTFHRFTAFEAIEKTAAAGDGNGSGTLFAGDKGMLACPGWGGSPALLPGSNQDNDINENCRPGWEIA